MNKCTDSQVGRRLYAYETGLLSDADRVQFEIHLLECKYCNDQARLMSDESRLIRQDHEVRSAVADLAATSNEASRRRPRMLQAVLAVAAVAVFLLLKPWQLEFRPTQEAVAADNRLAVMYFDNMNDPSDPDRLGEIIGTLIITDISESNYLKVVSSQRLFDILRTLDGEDSLKPGRSTAQEVAARTRAQWLLSGAIVQTDPAIALSWQLVDAVNGDVLASQTVTAQPEETIFALVDRITADVKDYLGLPLDALEEPDPPVADVTTHSAEAYRSYLEGMEHFSRLYYKDAAASFRQAVEYDSTFAMAYYYLAQLVSATYLDKAVQFADKTSRKEQMYIASLQSARDKDVDGTIAQLHTLVEQYPDEKRAWYRLGIYAFGRYKNRDAVRYLHEAIELDRLYKRPFDRLAYVYDELGEPDSAVWALNQYIALAPDEPNPYSTRGDILAKYGRLDESIASYEQAVSIKRDFASYTSLLTLGKMRIYTGEYDKARDIFQEALQRGGLAARSRARTNLALLSLYRGKLREANELLDDGITADRMEDATAGTRGSRDAKHYTKCIIAREWGKPDEALAEMRLTIDMREQWRPNDWYAYRYFLIQELALNKEFVEAEQVAATMKEHVNKTGIGLSDYLYGVGCIHLARRELDQAVATLEKAREGSDHFYISYMLALAYLEGDQPEKAAEELSAQLSNFSTWRIYAGLWAGKSHYYLGLAYEQMGENELAIAEYETLLAIWSEADEDLKTLAETRDRLAKLTATP